MFPDYPPGYPAPAARDKQRSVRHPVVAHRRYRFDGHGVDQVAAKDERSVVPILGVVPLNRSIADASDDDGPPASFAFK